MNFVIPGLDPESKSLMVCSAAITARSAEIEIDVEFDGG